MLNDRRWVFDLEIRIGVSAALVAHQQRITLRVIPRPFSSFDDFHQAAISVLAATRRYPLGHDGTAGVLADVRHLCAGVRLLVIVDQGDGVELPRGVVSLQYDAWVLPRDGRAGLDLSPGYLRVPALRLTPLGHEIVNATATFSIPGIPVLHR